MKAAAVLIEHHNVLRGLLQELDHTSCDDAVERRNLLDTLTDELGIHTQIEDELFYPAVRDASPLVPIAHAEHRQIDDQLAVVLRTDPGSADFSIEMQLLAAALEHHATEEERDMFPQAEALGDTELEALGRRLEARQQQLRASKVARTRLRLKRETLRRR